MATLERTAGSYHDSSNARIRKIGSYRGPAVYVTGGEPITAAELGMGRVELILFSPATDGTGYRNLVFAPGVTPAVATVKWVDSTTGLEVGAGANLAGYVARFEAIGK